MKYKFLTTIGLIILCIVVLIYTVLQFVQPAAKKELVIATGSTAGQYYQTALAYKNLLQADGVSVKVLNTAGSVENIQLLRAGKVDIAFIQNGVLKQDTTDHLELLASVYYEPLWLFYRKTIKEANNLQDFHGKKLAIGSKGSGTQDLAAAILKINEIDSTNTQLYNLGTQTAIEQLQSGQIDALFLVQSANSKVIQELLHDDTIELFSFQRSQAYSKRFVYLEPIDLHEGIVNLSKNMPEEDKQLLATTATLVASNDLSKEFIRLLLKKVKKIHSSKTLFAVNNQFPNINHTNLPLNEEASRYFQHGDSFLEKIFPFWIASHLDRLKLLLIPLLTLLFPLLKGISPLYRWSIRSKIYKWYKQIRDLEISMDTLDKTALANRMHELERIQTEITTEIKVPLSYMREYYDLLIHLDLIISKAQKRLEA